MVRFYDASGTLINSFEAAPTLPGVADGGNAPTIEELQAYSKNGKSPGATGTVEVSGSKCKDVTVSPTAGGSSRIVHNVKDLSDTSSEPCYARMAQVRVSTDGAAAYIADDTGREIEHVYFLDTNGDVVHTDTELGTVDQLTWAFDDLLIAVSNGQVTAFTPASA